MTPSEIEPATFRLVAQCLIQLRRAVIPPRSVNKCNLSTLKLVALIYVVRRSCSNSATASCSFRIPDTKIRENRSAGLKTEVWTHAQHGDLISLPLHLEGTKGGYKILNDWFL
jgi:hypothetical protein